MPVEAVTAEKLKEEGQTAYQNGDYQAAGRLFAAASQAFETRKESIQAAEMANNSSVAWLQAGDADQALQAVSGTDAVFALAGEVRLQAMALGNRAAALDALGRLEEAAILYDQSAMLLGEIGEGELRAYAMQALSKIQFRTGRQLEALATMQAGIEGIEKPSLRQRVLKKLLRFPMRILGTGPKN
jgi:tetratricopeptide (TPR) repeat protein